MNESAIQLPIINIAEDLVGNCVEHFTFGNNGKEAWFEGIVVCLKPDTDSELVIRYNCEEKLYSFAFSDYGDGLLRLLPLTSEFALGKKICQKFTEDKVDPEEINSWWETGLVVNVFIEDGIFKATVHFFEGDIESLDEEELDLIKPCEVLTYPILDDYLIYLKRQDFMKRIKL